jgi:hypothetical protein
VEKAKFSHSIWSKKGAIAIDPQPNLKLGTTTGGGSMRGASLKAVQELLGHASLAMTMRYAHLSHEHLKDSVNLLNDIPSGKEMVNIGLNDKKASNPSIANLL